MNRLRVDVMLRGKMREVDVELWATLATPAKRSELMATCRVIGCETWSLNKLETQAIHTAAFNRGRIVAAEEEAAA